MTLVCGATDCFSQNETDVCYTAFQVKSGLTANLYSGANASAPVRATMNAGAHFARQSSQNYPGCSVSPSLRPARNGFVFGYEYTSNKFGWVDATTLQIEDSLTVCGPAGKDFNCGYNPTSSGRCSTQNICDGGAQSGSSDSRNLTIYAQQLDLRYAPSSTPFDLLISGDTVFSYCTTGTYLCVVITKSKYASIARGWVLNDYNSIH
jgi:hypothetical protein